LFIIIIISIHSYSLVTAFLVLEIGNLLEQLWFSLLSFLVSLLDLGSWEHSGELVLVIVLAKGVDEDHLVSGEVARSVSTGDGLDGFTSLRVDKGVVHLSTKGLLTFAVQQRIILTLIWI
jgi:hypothetical protein